MRLLRPTHGLGINSTYEEYNVVYFMPGAFYVMLIVPLHFFNSGERFTFCILSVCEMVYFGINGGARGQAFWFMLIVLHLDFFLLTLNNIHLVNMAAGHLVWRKVKVEIIHIEKIEPNNFFLQLIINGECSFSNWASEHEK